jgi:hypothetical protein
MATTRVENNGDPQKLYEVLSGAGVISANSLSFDQFRNRVLNEEGFADTIYNAGRRSEQKGRLGEYHIEGETVGDFMQAYFPPVVKKKDTEDLSTLPTQESSAPGESLPADDGLFGAFPTQPLDIQEYDPETFEWDKYLTLIAASQGNLLSNEEFKDKLQQMGEQGDPLESFIYNLPGGIPAFGTNSSIKVTPQDDDTGTLGKIEYMSYLDDPSGKAVVYLNNAGLVRQTGLGSGAQIVSALTGDALVLEGFNPAEETDFEKLSVFVASAQKTNDLLSIIDLHSDKAVGKEFREKRDELKARVGEVRRQRVGGRSGVPMPSRNRRTGRYVGQEADERAGIRYEGRWQIDEYTEAEYIDDVYQLRKEYQDKIRNDYDARLRDAVLNFIPDPKGYQVVGDETGEGSYAGAETRETGIISEELSGERNLYRQLDDYIFENTGAYIDLDGNGRLNEQFLVEDIARGFAAGAVDQVIAPIGYLATAGIDLFSSPFGGDFSLSRRLRLNSQNVSSYLREGMTYIPKGFTSSIASGDVYNATRLLTTQTAEAIPLIGTTLLSGGVANTFFGAGKIGMLATTTGTTAMLAGTSTYMSVKDNPNFSSDMDRFLYSLSAAGAESAQGLLLGHFQFKYMQNMRNLRSGAYGSVGRGLLNKSNTNIMIQNGLTPVVGALEEGSAYAMERYAYSAFTGEEIDPTEYRDGLIMSMSVGGVMGAGMDFVGNSGQRRQALVNSRYNRDFLIEVDGLSAIVEESKSYQQFKQDAIERLGEERGLSEAQIKKQELIVQMTGDILSNNQKKYSEFYSMMQVRHPEAMARLAELDLRIAYGEALLKDPMLGGTDGTASPDAVLVTSVIEPLVRERMAIEAEFAGETTTLTMAEQAQYNVNQNMDMLNSLIEEVDMSSASLAILKENVDQNPGDAQLQKLYDDAKQTHDALVGRKQEIIRLSEEAFALRTKLQEQTKSEADSTTDQEADADATEDTNTTEQSTETEAATENNIEQVRADLEKVERQLAGVMGKPYSEVSTANLGADPTGPVDLRSDTERMNMALYGEQAQKMGYDPSERNAYQRFKDLALIKLQDKYRDLTVIQRDIESQRREKTGQGLPTDQNFLAAEETFYGKAANDLRLLEKSQDDIVKILRDNKISVSELSEFMYAKHASERNRVARERENQKLVRLNEIASKRELTSQERAELVKIEKNLSNESFGSGMSDARAKEILDGVPEGKRKAMEQAFNLTQDIIADTRKTMRDFNLESSQTIDAWESMFDNYTPLAGLAADESAGTLEYPTGGSGFQVYGSETMAITGRESLSQNLLAQVINQNAVTKMRARRNEVMITLYNMVDNNPNASMWRTSDTRPDQADLKRTGEGVVALKIDGKDKYVILKNKDLADKLKGYGTTQVAKWVRFVGAPSRVLRNLHTSYNPEFIITNYLRDIQHAVYSAAAESDVRGGVIDEASVRGIAVDSSKNIKYLFRYNRNPNDARIPAEVKLYIDEFKANGAETGWSYLKDLETLQAELESATEQGKGKRAAEWMADNTYKFVEGINGAFENSIRLSAYIKARESGVDATTAAQFAKNITVNFNKSGEWTNTANSLYYFFNAGVQGSYRTARNLTTPRSEYRVDGSKREWYQRMTTTQKYAVGATAFASLLTLFNQMTSEEDEESGMSYYQQIPHSIKSRNMIIMTGGESYISIPLPYGYGAIHAAAVNGTEVGLNLQDPSEAVWNTTDDVFNNFSPVTFSKSDNEAQKIIRTIAPDILDPLVDLSTNETYFGGKIYDERNVSSGDPARAYMAEEEVDPSVMKGLINDFTQILNETAGGSEMKSSGFFDWNPDIVEYLVEYYAGGTGRFIKDAGGAIIDIGEVTTNYLNGEPQDIVIDPSDIPFLRKVYGEADGKFYHLPTYYENRDKILELRNVLELDKEQGTNDFNSVFQEMFPEYQGDVEKGMIAVRQMVREYEDSFEVIKKSNRIIRNNRDRLENNEITDKEFYKIFNIQMDKKNKAYKNSNRLLYNLQLGVEPSLPYRIGEPGPDQTRMPEQSKYRR